MPRGREAFHIIDHLGRGERALFFTLLLIAIVSLFAFLIRTSGEFLTQVPSTGGELREGVVGSPIHINPVLAKSTTIDSDLTMLTHSGLLYYDSTGELKPNLAKSYQISEDGLEYSFTLRNDLKWHDGEQITSDDVIFTIQQITNSNIASPRARNFDGVQVARIDELNFKFILSTPYAPFLAVTTVGIIPEHLWSNVATEQFGFDSLNIDKAIGSGPYKISDINRDKDGVIKSIVLRSFADYALGQANISKITVNFYSSESELINAYVNGKVQSIAGFSNETASDLLASGFGVLRAPLPKTFVVFFNQSKNSLLENGNLREILDISIDKHKIVEEALRGFAQALDGPLPNQIKSFDPSYYTNSTSTPTNLTGANTAISDLTEGNWELGEDGVRSKKGRKLAFTLSTQNIPELLQVASILQSNWEALGADIELKTYEEGDFKDNIIVPRDFEILLFGQTYNSSIYDPSPLWHSNARLHPGLNVAGYTSSESDRVLEALREESSPKERKILEEEFGKIVDKDKPAVFLYVPEYVYLPANHVNNINISRINNKSDRFSNIHEWYINTEKVWTIFSSN